MRAALAVAVVLIAAGCGGGTTTVTVTTTRTHTVTKTVTASPTTTAVSEAACAGADLRGSFAVQAGSAGAGNIVYTLTLTNRSAGPCFVSGIPSLLLLDRQGAPLPTTVSPAHPGTATAVKVTLRPGDSAVADARFSPDVPGPTEQHSGPCEKTAATLRVSPAGGGSVDVPVMPPTPVCGAGALSVSNLTAP